MFLQAIADQRRRIVFSPYVHPHYRAVAETYLRATDAALDVATAGEASARSLAESVDEDTAALVVQSPNFLGGIEDLTGVAETVHAKGALLIVVVDPISLGLLRPPGDFGADVVVADGQALGIAPSFGGPSLGIFATRRSHIRRLVGRLVGAGPANLACALRLAQLLEEHNRTAEAPLEPMIAVIEKSADIGDHILSGAVLDPRALRERIFADTLLTRQKDVAILFSFSRAYFLVDMEVPSAYVSFLLSFMPSKSVVDLYAMLGLQKQAKTLFYRQLQHHLGHSRDNFQVAPGAVIRSAFENAVGAAAR